MQKLVLILDNTDHCTYFAENFLTFWYQSKEKAEEEFFVTAYRALEQWLEGDNTKSELSFFRSISLDLWNYWSPNRSHSKTMKDFTYQPPIILTIDEWFERQIEHC